MRRLWRLLRVILHILLGLLLALVCDAFRAPYRPRVRRIVRWWLQYLLKVLAVRVRVQGQAPTAGHFLVSNHISWLDIPVLAAQADVYFLSKAEVRQWPLIGALAAAAGTLFIRRGGGESKQKAEEIAGHLRDGRNILLFPEGTTTDGSGVRRFFRQLFAAPVLADVPVQPVALRYPERQGARPEREGPADRDIAFINDDAFHIHLWRLLLRDEIVADVTFCTPLLPIGHTPGTLAQQCHTQISATL
ncbi:lysophospholipid acyltransferase family protein [Alcanivorax quisquiliarum]|uniref:1-acyl-sn-glycerol-3-phosphate acyltransferase n=1 Tax=Alcanivorax quisquiliarum TaxID=2933565 RepID=A0ABT0E8T5_9GAMM|nr:lysophospholipid acyltransferase family protein [Alcanivorax quisquiliarum]MCK0538252.1 1-acyl-sn-glycerol-3-phosphate acyltransferase [Alcanivorax quisquiliarum]